MHAPRTPAAFLGLAALTTLGLSAGRPACAQFSAPTVVMHGLANPHGLKFGPDGGLYVSEAGTGGPGPSIVAGDGSVNGYGLTGGISRLLHGVQTRVVSGVPSLAPAGGSSALGLTDVAFDPAGTDLYGIMGFGTDPHERASLTAAGVSGDAFGQLVKFNLADGSRANVADVAAAEYANPDGTDPDSQPYSLLRLEGGMFVVADAGGNDLLQVNPTTGDVSVLTVFHTAPGSYQPVPDAVVMGPDGQYYVGQLTGAPFPTGAANVYRVNPKTGKATVAASGFTNIADLAFSPDGTLNVLEISEHGLANPNGPVPGALLSVNLAKGTRTLVADNGLVFPTGMTVGPDGSLYVSNFGVSPDGGQVLRFAPTLSAYSLAPHTRRAGSGRFTLTVRGTDFVSGSIVKWNGAAQSTVFVSSTTLTATIPASLTAASGTASVAVTTPHVATTAPLSFTITP